MIQFILGLVTGIVATAALVWIFIAWAVSGAEKSLKEDIEQHENDNI